MLAQLGCEWTSNLLYALVPWLTDMSGRPPTALAWFLSRFMPLLLWLPDFWRLPATLWVPRVHMGFLQMYSKMAMEQAAETTDTSDDQQSGGDGSTKQPAEPHKVCSMPYARHSMI